MMKQTAGSNIIKLDALSEVDGIFAPAVSSKNLMTKWHGFCLERHRIFSNAVTPEICFPTHIIGFLLNGNYKKDIFDTGTPRRTIVHNSGDTLLYPFGLPHIGHSFSQADFLVLYLEPKFVEKAAQEVVAGERIEIIPQPNFKDEFVSDVTKHLLAEVDSGGTIGTLYAESLMTALAARLVKNYSTARTMPCEYKGGLARVKQRLVIEYINEHLAEDLSLEKLATLCCLSQYHFAKQFKRSNGFAPHQYVTSRRMEQAKSLLAKTDWPIAEIALRVGCASQSHLSNLFRKVTGTSPSSYRRAL